ncbi:Oligosaccharide translocation protein rft1 [Borealophlyctis nickersoniae]|nr:Oligosaccharide translocation protein rft1 [Borealophlyctis nickersoniae]
MALLRNPSGKGSTDETRRTEDAAFEQEEGGGSRLRRRKVTGKSDGGLKAASKYSGLPVSEIHQKVVNLSFVPVFVGFLITAIVAAYKAMYPRQDHPLPATALYVFAAMLELCSEPLYIIVQTNLLYKIRVQVEGAALFAKCITTLAYIYLAPVGKNAEDVGAMAYAFGQFAYGGSLLLGYLVHLRKKHVVEQLNTGADAGMPLWRQFLPRAILDDRSSRRFYFDPYLSSVAWSFTAQSLLKHLLTEGDRILLLGLGRGNDEKGAYRLVSDLGSLIARILFQPLEEISRAYFSKTLTSPQGAHQSGLKIAMDLLSTLLRFHILLGLYFVFLATNYTTTLIDILFGSAKSSTEIPGVLAAYCLYVPIMGINGITEAFLQGVGDSKVLAKQSAWMVGFSVIFASVVYVTVHVLEWGAVGLVLANIVNLVMRIAFSWIFIRAFFLVDAKEHVPTREADIVERDFQSVLSPIALLPKWILWVGFAISWGVTAHFGQYFGHGSWRSKFWHVVVGGICGVAVTSLV